MRGYVVRTGGRVLDPAADGFIVELTASEAEINAFIADLARQAELLEVARSGALGMGRARSQTQKLRIVGKRSYASRCFELAAGGEGEVFAPGRPPIRCCWMMRSRFSGVQSRYQMPSG